MTVRWYLSAAFGPNEVAPQWPFLLFVPLPLVAVALAYLRLRKAAV